MSKGQLSCQNSTQVYEAYEAALFRVALMELLAEEADALETDEAACAPDPVADARVLKKMDRSFHRWHQAKTLRRVLPRVAMTAACVALTFFVGLSTAVATNATVRQQLMQLLFILNDHEAQLSLEPMEDGAFDVPASWRGLYYPSYIPAGYELNDLGETYVSFRYWHDPDKEISFTESDENTYVSIDTEDADIRYTQVNGAQAVLSIKPEFSFITWAQGSRYFIVETNCDDEWLLTRIARGVRRLDG